MKRISLLLLALLLGSLSLPAETVNGQQRILGSSWRIFQGGTGAALSLPGAALPETSWPASVPSTVLGSLVEAGEYPGCLESRNYAAIDPERFASPWWYRTEFTVVPEPGKHYLLCFDGISYSADIWFNGQFIDQATGPFRRFCYDITAYIQENNSLAVQVRQALPGEPGIGFVDWNPRPADESMGLFREVKLITVGEVAMEHTTVRSTLDGTEASLTVETRLTNLTDRPVRGRLVGTVDGKRFYHDLTLAGGEEKTVVLTEGECPALRIREPRLWWCNGMGSPDMYSLGLSFVTETGLSDSQTLDFGIRQVEQYYTPEGHLAFRLNGREVLLRGAGWTDDIFLRDNPRSNAMQVAYVRDMNLNLIRFEEFWGTSENVYDLCDRNGIMVLVGWSCFWEWEVYLRKPHDPLYGGILTPAEVDLVSTSFEDQVYWLRAHPSILAWFTGSDRIPLPDLEMRYRDFLSAHDDRGYITSASGLKSPISGPAGTKMMGPYDYVGPIYWYSPEAPGKAVGFNTETGIGAQLPVRESLERMGLEMTWPTGTDWDYHCTVAAEDMHSLDALKRAVKGHYGEPADLETFLKEADHLNYDGTRAMFEAFRVQVPRATGIVQWMLNSAWPSLYWQLYDWYGQPTAAYYAVKAGNAPVQLIYHYADKKVYAVNETQETVEASAVLECYQSDGSKLWKSTRPVVVEPYRPVEVAALPSLKKGCTFLQLRLERRGQVLARNSYVLTPQEDVHDWAHSTWYDTPISRYADFRPLLKMKQTAVSLEKTWTAEGDLLVTVTNTGSAMAFQLRLAARAADGSLLCPVFWEDNWMTLAPGERRTLRCTLPVEEAGRLDRITVSGWNVPAAAL